MYSASSRPASRFHRHAFYLRTGYDVGKKIWSRYRQGNIDHLYLLAGYGNHMLEWTGGKEIMPYRHPTFSMMASGYYWKVGYHYNFYDNWGDMHNEITLGVRYGHANFSYELRDIRIDYPPPYEGTYLNPGPLYFPHLRAWWLELATAVRAELFHHFYLDLMIAGKWMPRIPQAANMTAVYVPGFYQTNISHFGFGLGYGISYRFGF